MGRAFLRVLRRGKSESTRGYGQPGEDERQHRTAKRAARQIVRTTVAFAHQPRCDRVTNDDTTVTRVPLDAKAWHLGCVAGRRGLMQDCDPFPIPTAQALAWSLGWSAGRMKPVRAVVSDEG